MPTYKHPKAMARSLRDALSHRKVSLSHSECLEIVAQQFGFADWNTLSAQLTAEEERLARPAGPEISLPGTIRASAPGPLPEWVPVMPLRDVVVYPEIALPIYVGRKKSAHGVDIAMRGDKWVILVTQRQPGVDDPGSEDLYRIGTLANVLNATSAPNCLRVVVKGISRARIDLLQAEDHLSARIGRLTDIQAPDVAAMDAVRERVMARFARYADRSGLEAKLSKLGAPPLPDMLARFSRLDLSKFTDTIAAHTPLQLTQKQEILETLDVGKRLEYVDAATGDLETGSSAPA